MTTSIINLKTWLEQNPGSQEAPDTGPPTGEPFQSPMGMAENPSASGKPEDQPAGGEENPDNEDDNPKAPDMEDTTDRRADFQTWRKEFFELAIKGDTNDMIDAINQVRDRNLGATERRFVEDNFQILLLRQDSNIEKASKEIRKLINEQLDRNNPAVSLLQHITQTLGSYPMLNDIFIKLAGQGGFKGELHRRFVAALMGAIQRGVGAVKPDLIYSARDYSIDISTRFYTKFGDIKIAKWTLQEDDPEKFLAEAEQERLESGSPEEKKVLRRRICLESIATKYNQRAFLMHIVDPDDGKIHQFAWDIAEGLRMGYTEGKLVVRKKKSEYRDAMIDDDGSIIPLFAYAINYKRDTGDISASGEFKTQEVPFMEQREGTLYLTAAPEVLQELAGSLPGLWYNVTPYQGNPSDIVNIMRCAPSSVEQLMRRC